MGLDYTIHYWKGKENVVADVLSRKEEKGNCQAITVVLEWVKDIAGSYEQTNWLKNLLAQLIVQPIGNHGYTLSNGLIRFKGRLVVGEDKLLKERILKTLPC